jgi:hypothetical protein
MDSSKDQKQESRDTDCTDECPLCDRPTNEAAHKIMCDQQGEVLYSLSWESDTCGNGGGSIDVVRLGREVYVNDSAMMDFHGPMKGSPLRVAKYHGLLSVSNATWSIRTHSLDDEAHVEICGDASGGHLFSLNGRDVAVSYDGRIVAESELPPKCPELASDAILVGEGILSEAIGPTAEASIANPCSGIYELPELEGYWLYDPKVDESRYYKTLEEAKKASRPKPQVDPGD